MPAHAYFLIWFFITHGPTPHLNGMHTVFGTVAGDEDQNVVDSIVQGDTIEKITIKGNTGSLLKKVTRKESLPPFPSFIY